MAGFAKKALVLFILSVFPGCVPNANIDLLAPRKGKVVDVIDIRDPSSMSLGTEGSVSFGPVQALRILTSIRESSRPRTVTRSAVTGWTTTVTAMWIWLTADARNDPKPS